MINYFKLMKSGIYSVYVDRMSLFDKDNPGYYTSSTILTNDGELHTYDDDYPEIIETAINILGMIIIHKKGYSIELKNHSNIKEIVELVYGHITACIEAKRNSLTQEFTVPVEDLIDMENFMVSILEANPIYITELFSKELKDKMMNTGFMSSFEDNNTSIDVIKADIFRRVSKVDDFNFTMSDLLNTL